MTYLVKDYLISTLESSISQSEEFISSLERHLDDERIDADWRKRKKSELNEATNRLTLKRRALEEVMALKTA